MLDVRFFGNKDESMGGLIDYFHVFDVCSD